MIRASLIVWVLLIFLGVGALGRFSFTPGEKAAAPLAWPQLSTIAPPKQLPSLLIFIHPECGCSQATMNEMERLAPVLKGRASVYIVLNEINDSKPFGQGKAYKQASSILRMNSEIHLIVDSRGQEATLFGARTSGQALLYDERGELVFAGGLTPARGHEGESEGKSAILAWVESRTLTVAASDVFGCPMKGSR